MTHRRARFVLAVLVVLASLLLLPIMPAHSGTDAPVGVWAGPGDDTQPGDLRVIAIEVGASSDERGYVLESIVQRCGDEPGVTIGRVSRSGNEVTITGDLRCARTGRVELPGLAYVFAYDPDMDEFTADDAGVQTRQCGPGSTTHVGTSDDDVLVGTSGMDVIDGRGGDDVLKGKGGIDILCGGSGADVLVGAGGHDVMIGDAGSDVFRGDGGADATLGGGGNDRARTSLAGHDSFAGGRGKDEFKGGRGNDHGAGGPDDDELSGNAGKDVLFGEGGTDSVDGGTGTDTCDAENEASCEE